MRRILVFVLLVSSATARQPCDDVTFKQLLGIEKEQQTCAQSAISRSDDAWTAEDAINVGVSIAAGIASLLPGPGSIIGPFISIFSSLCSGDNGFRDALDEQYDKLINCMDTKFNEYRQESLESDWRALTSSFIDFTQRIVEGGSLEQAHEEMNRLFEDLNAQIERHFGKLQSESEYLEAESLLPTLKLMAKLYWLTFTEHLGLLKKAIDSGNTHQTQTDYAYDLQLAQQNCAKMKAWAENAYRIIRDAYTPGIHMDADYAECSGEDDENCYGIWADDGSYGTYYVTIGIRDNSGDGRECEPNQAYGAISCLSCFKKQINDGFDAFIAEFQANYIDLFVELASKSTTIGAVQGDLRLAGSGSTTYEGRVEIYMNGEWGTVCNDGIESNSDPIGMVICGQLKHKTSGYTLYNKQSEQSSSSGCNLPFGCGFTGRVSLDSVTCTGTEERIIDCAFSSTPDCGHHEDLGIICVPSDAAHSAMPGLNVVYDDNGNYKIYVHRRVFTVTIIVALLVALVSVFVCCWCRKKGRCLGSHKKGNYAVVSVCSDGV